MTTSRVTTFRLGGFEGEALQARFGAERFDRHFHESYSIGLVMDGANVFAYRGREVEVEAGAICLADPGEVHDGGRSGCSWEYVNAFPPADLMKAVAEDAGLPGPPAFAAARIVDPECTSELRRWLQLLFDEGAETAEVEQAGFEALGSLIARHAEGARGILGAVPDGHIARRALEALHDGWSEVLTLEDLAKASGSSRFGVIRAVSAATGLTPHAYLIQLRVTRAKELIRAGTSLAEAALACGFADQAHLTRAMKRRWGATPGAFKSGRGQV
jgi:AraC-like DNA-binding protein